GPHHWIVCEPCRRKWYLGFDMFNDREVLVNGLGDLESIRRRDWDWKSLSRTEWEARFEAIRDYEVVTPSYHPRWVLVEVVSNTLQEDLQGYVVGLGHQVTRLKQQDQPSPHMAIVGRGLDPGIYIRVGKALEKGISVCIFDDTDSRKGRGWM